MVDLELDCVFGTRLCTEMLRRLLKLCGTADGNGVFKEKGVFAAFLGVMVRRIYHQDRNFA